MGAHPLLGRLDRAAHMGAHPLLGRLDRAAHMRAHPLLGRLQISLGRESRQGPFDAVDSTLQVFRTALYLLRALHGCTALPRGTAIRRRAVRAADRADGAAERAARPRRAPTLIPIVAPFPTDCRFGDFGGLPGRPAGVEAAANRRVRCRERPEDLTGSMSWRYPKIRSGRTSGRVCGGLQGP